MIVAFAAAVVVLGVAAAVVWAAVSDQLDDFDSTLYDF